MQITEVLRPRPYQFDWASASLAKPCDAKSLRNGPTGVTEHGLDMVWHFNQQKWGYLNHPFLDGIFPHKPSIWGDPHEWKPPNGLNNIRCSSRT